MTPQNPREELEIRLTALLLGELPEEEAAELKAQMETDPELAALFKRLQNAAGLLREAIALPEETPLKLSGARREQLLAHFKTTPLPVPRREWKWAIAQVLAASVAILIGVVTFSLQKSQVYIAPPDFAAEGGAAGAAEWASQPGSIRTWNKDSNGRGEAEADDFVTAELNAPVPQSAPAAAPDTHRFYTRHGGANPATPAPSTSLAMGRAAAVPATPSTATGMDSIEQKAKIYLPQQVSSALGVPGEKTVAQGRGSTREKALAPSFRGRAAADSPSEPQSMTAAPADPSGDIVTGTEFFSLAKEQAPERTKGLKDSAVSDSDPSAMFGAEVAKNAAGAAVHEGFDVSAGKAIQPSSGARGFGGGAGGGGFGGVYGEKPVVLSDEALVAEAKKPVVVATGQIATKQDRAGLSFSQTDAIASRRKLSLSTAEANSLGRDNLQTASKGMHWDRGISKALKESDSEDATAPAKPDSNGQPLEVTINRHVDNRSDVKLDVLSEAETDEFSNRPNAETPLVAGNQPRPATAARGSVLRATAAKKAELKAKADSAEDQPAAPAPKPAPVPQPEIQTSDNAFSTFSLNVSDVSFKLADASLEQGTMPDPSTVRSEEFINAFDYRDPEPAQGVPLAFASERARDPFAQNRDLLRLSVKTAAAGRQPGRALNVVLLLDNSGSMERADRVGILREALRVLSAQLQAQDKLSIITFARTPRLWADGVAGNQAATVTARAGEITPQGGTNLAAALDLGYQTALRHYQPGSISRVVVLTDGAANLGDVDPAALKQKIEAHRKQGVALDCFGIGWEGYNDDLLEQLSRNGDGRYGFINTPEEAATEFAGQLAGALRVAASDVKVQVEFNPRRVTAFRQIGYAKHQLTKEQFRDNTVDAAEIGAAESGNALYAVQVNPQGEGDLAIVRVRFKVPGTSDYQEHEWSVPFTSAVPPFEQASPTLRLAGTAAAFSEWLAGNPAAGAVTSDRLLGYLRGVSETFGADPRPRRLEWMIRQAKSVSGR